MPRTAWIGLVHVTGPPEHEVLDGGAGAYVNALVLSNSKSEFEDLARAELERMGFDVAEIDDVERLTKRLEDYDVDDILLRMAEGLTSDEPVAFDTFNIYEEDE